MLPSLGRRHIATTLIAVTLPHTTISFAFHCLFRSACSNRFTCSTREPSAGKGTAIKMAAAEEANKPVWDTLNGVWVNNKAAGLEESRYGSLCWRPEASFEGFETLDGGIVGWRRLFAQKSMDHRGTPQFPGLVATVIADAELEAIGARSPDEPPSRTHGVAYRVPDERTESVLGNLDFREKGGYTRAVVDVLPSVGTGAPIRALLYTASTDNPNFFISDTPDDAAATIAAAVGPSGPNYEYLFFLADYLQNVGHPDDHVSELTELVRLRMKGGKQEEKVVVEAEPSKASS